MQKKKIYKCDRPIFREPYSGVFLQKFFIGVIALFWESYSGIFKPYSDILEPYSGVFLQNFLISHHTRFKGPYSGVFKPYSDVLKPYSGVFLQIFYKCDCPYSGCPIVAFLSPIVTL